MIGAVGVVAALASGAVVPSLVNARGDADR